RKEERKRRAREADEFFSRSEGQRRAAPATDPGLLKFAGQQLPRPTNPGGARGEDWLRVSLDPKKRASSWLEQGQIRFELEYRRASDPPTVPWVTLSSDSSATFDVTGLSAATKYVFRGRAGARVAQAG
ncbi:hypothetical protein Agub_g9469, partial [Astrephomene gubernaculifera]